MFRSVSDVLEIKHSPTEVLELLKSKDSEKERFILGLKFILADRESIGFKLLNSIQLLDTSDLIDKQLIEELLSPQRSVESFDTSIKIVGHFYRLGKAKTSQRDIFEMAIHQNMVQFAESSKVKGNLSDVLKIIKLITETMKENQSSNHLQGEFLSNLCSVLLKKISQVPVPREAVNIQTINYESSIITEFFKRLRSHPSYTEISTSCLQTVYLLIKQEGEVSSLTCLGLAVIHDTLIGPAVSHILSMDRSFNNQRRAIVTAIKRLINWQKTSGFDVPLHLWIAKVLTALHDDKQYEILNEVIGETIEQCFLTLILPAFQVKTFAVVHVMLETQRTEEIFRKLMARIVNVLSHLEKTKSQIFEPLLDAISDYVSSFADLVRIDKDVVAFLESHQRATFQSRSKWRMTSSRSLQNVRIGLENLGNTCYINSVIQALFMTKPFCKELLLMESRDRDTMAVQKIFAMLLFSDRTELNLKFAMPHIRPFDFMPGIQHDSSEFMGSLLDKLHEADKKFLKSSRDWDEEMTDSNGASCSNDSGINVELSSVEASPTSEQDGIEIENKSDDVTMKTPVDKMVDNTSELNDASFVQKSFGGKLSTTCVCSSCESKSISIDAFRDLALSFPERNEDDWDADTEFSVQKLLDFYFTSEKLSFDADNQYQCEKCKSLCDGVRCTELLQPPKNLILTLKHFRYDSRYHTRSKLLIKKMYHDEVITVKVRSSHEGGERIVKYRLYAAVVHSGVSLDSGHYYTFARENDQTWYKFNDSFVSTSSLHELHNLNSPNTPYILFYRRISTASSSTASSATACLPETPMNDVLPNYMANLPDFLKRAVEDDNAAFNREAKKYSFQSKPISNRWNENDDEDPPPSCGNFDVQHNRFIF